MKQHVKAGSESRFCILSTCYLLLPKASLKIMDKNVFVVSQHSPLSGSSKSIALVMQKTQHRFWLYFLVFVLR